MQQLQAKDKGEKLPRLEEDQVFGGSFPLPAPFVSNTLLYWKQLAIPSHLCKNIILSSVNPQPTPWATEFPVFSQELWITDFSCNFEAESSNTGTFQQAFCCSKKRNRRSRDALLEAAQEQKQLRHNPPFGRMTDSDSLVPLSLIVCNVWLYDMLRDKNCLPLSGEAPPKPGL